MIDGDGDHFSAFRGELPAELAGGGMLDRGGDDLLSRGARDKQAANGGVDGFGATAGETDLRIGCMDEIGNL